MPCPLRRRHHRGAAFGASGVGSTPASAPKGIPWPDSSAPTASVASQTARTSPPSSRSTVSVAAAHVLGQVGADHGHRPGRRRAGPAGLGRVPGGRRRRRGWPRRASTCTTSGVLPTPAVAYLTADTGADFGVMLSASHNPMPDNGIKFFARGGHKLARRGRGPHRGRDGRAVGPPHRRRRRPHRDDAGRRTTRYIAHLLGSCRNRLDGLRVVIDGAHGAASEVAPAGVPAAGAEVVVIGTATRRPQHQRRLRLDPPRAAAGRRRGARAPTSASPSTGTPTAAWRSTPPAPLVDGDQIMGILAVALQGARHARARHPRRHRDEQPRPDPGDGARRDPGAPDRRSATGTCSRGCAPAATPSVASSRATSSCSTTGPPATAC